MSHRATTGNLRSCVRSPTVPVTVTYELTDLGRSLHLLVREIKTNRATRTD